MDEEPFEPCSVGTVLLPRGRKTVANDIVVPPQAQLVTLPSTLLDASVNPTSTMTGNQCIPENRYDQDASATTVAERYATPTTTSSTTPRSSKMDQPEVIAELSDTPPTTNFITPEKFERVYPFPEVATPAVTPTATSVTPHTATAATQTTTVATPTETLITTQPQMELKITEPVVANLQAREEPTGDPNTHEDTTVENCEFDPWAHDEKWIDQAEEWELLPTDQWEEPSPEFEELVTEKLMPDGAFVDAGTAEMATAEVGPLEPVLEEAEEALLMETEEGSGWEDQENPVVPGPSTKPGVKREQAATEDESDDEIFTDAVAEPTTEDRNDPELLESSQEHPEAETPGPQRVSNEADTTANRDDPTNPYRLRRRAPVDYRKVAQKQLEMIEGMEGDPPLEEFVQQVFDTYQEEVDANATIPTDTLTTPEPCNAPQITLAGIVNCIRYAARGDMRMTRTANAQAAVVGVLTLARWIPQYQRIAQERDQLLEHQEKWRLEKAAAQKRIKELEGAVKPETGEQIAVVEVAAPPQVTNEQSSDYESPIRARRSRRNEIPSSTSSSIDGITRLRPRTPSPQLARYRVATGTTPAAMGPPPTATGKQATSISPSPGTSREGLAFLPTPIKEPKIVIKPCQMSAKIIPKIVLKKNRVSPAKRHHKRKLQCPICRRHCGSSGDNASIALIIHNPQTLPNNQSEGVPAHDVEPERWRGFPLHYI
ncbi:hypothetical protein GE061_015309 [Apolygus lucorum]|uniref:Uncharacterized protein n=1 Tax=Apolygus lucorum TaxID=248454 RepID=A0A8S9XMP1_APOLU|nr:hypothetical protein GE061_015309 [Apolygus lucorum]